MKNSASGAGSVYRSRCSSSSGTSSGGTATFRFPAAVFGFGYSVLTDDRGRFAFREWGDVSGGMLLGAVIAVVVVAVLVGFMVYGIRRWFPTKEQREHR